MADHDEFFKTLLAGFPAEFLDLVAPRLAVGLDVERRAVIGRELFTDFPEPAEHRFRCMQAIAGAELSEHQRRLLGNCVGTYLELTGDDRRRYEEMITKEKATEIEAMEGTWFGKIARQAKEQGEVRGERRMLQRMLESRFGPLSDEHRRRIQALDSAEEIERIFDHALQVSSLGDLKLDE